MDVLEWGLSTLRFASPLILVAMAGLLSERSGVINIALEGFILFGAFAGAAVAFQTSSPWFGLFAAMVLGLVVGLFYAWLVVGLKADQIVAGTAINMIAWGGIPFVGKIIYDSTANTPALELSQRLPSWSPFLLAGLAFAVVVWVLYQSRLGLLLTFAGEKPEVLATVGVRADYVRWAAVSCSGVLAGIGGAELSLALSSSYTRNMAAGRGFMALAALILGKWHPGLAVAACILFGFCDVLQLRLQGVKWPGIGEFPLQLVQIIPYVVTLGILAGFVGESRAPAALGKPLSERG